MFPVWQELTFKILYERNLFQQDYLLSLCFDVDRYITSANQIIPEAANFEFQNRRSLALDWEVSLQMLDWIRHRTQTQCCSLNVQGTTRIIFPFSFLSSF